MARLKAHVERAHLMMGDLPELAAQLSQLARDHGRITMAEA
ncbi:hypothetical protein [Roseobacter sp.]